MLEGRFAELADLLFDLGAIQFGAFKLKLHETDPDAPLSPIYLNLRTQDNPKPGPLTPEALSLIAEVMYGLIQLTGTKPYNYFTGIPNAGDPFADALAPRLRDIAQIHLVKEEEDGKRRIAGVRESLTADLVTSAGPANVLVVDDLITQAGTKLEAVKVLEDNGFAVTNLLVLVDREQGGREQIESAGYQLYSVFTLEQLLEHYVESGKIEQDVAESVHFYVFTNRSTK